MGAKLTRNRSLIISRKNDDQQEITAATNVENITDHLDVIATTEDNKSKQKKMKKKQEFKLEKTKVDKSTNTENCVLPVSLFSEQLVDDKLSTGDTNDVLLKTSTAQINVAYQTEVVTSKHEQQISNASTQNRIISSDFHISNQEISNVQDYHTSILNNLTDATAGASSTIIVNTDEVLNSK
ncbi:hypothetical protein I4U23_009301 [Adineta vaga]|nr:hypothetical protein I4U23_009301 [Adineta vaga]